MRRVVTWSVLAGVFLPPAFALFGYLAAGKPHVACGDSAGTAAFYRVALPFFAAAGLVGAAALVRLSRTGRALHGGPPVGEGLAALVALVALDALLPGALHQPAAAVVVVAGLGAIVGAVVTAPVTLGLVVAAGTWLGRRRDDPAPDRWECRIYAMLVAWVLVAALPALIVGIALQGDPICFTF